MNNIIKIDFNQGNIPVSRQLSPGQLRPAIETSVAPLAEEHAAEPIKDVKVIQQISEYLIAQGRYRDNMLFICGINFGLRISDLREIGFYHLIDNNFRFKDGFSILEIKTKNTRKTKRNRWVAINDAVVWAVTLYLEHNECSLSDYLFRSEGNRKSGTGQLSRKSADRILKGIAEDLQLDIRMSTHTLRKTFGYHQMRMSGNDHRKLLLLQKMFGHSSVYQTLDYIGITKEEIAEAYMELNLGLYPGNLMSDVISSQIS